MLWNWNTGGSELKVHWIPEELLEEAEETEQPATESQGFSTAQCLKGWLPPSLKSRVFNIETWVNRLRKVCNVQAISMELVRFDTQLMENPNIAGVQYQQGELMGFEVKEYLLEKWGQSLCLLW